MGCDNNDCDTGIWERTSKAPVETPRNCSNCGHPIPCHCDDVGWGAAPVETPEKMRPPFEDLCDRCITGTHCIVNGCCLAETRATAPVPTRLTAEQLAQKFHEAYERLAPQFSYETRKASAKPWAEVPENNRRLMTAVCAEILEAFRDKSEAGLRDTIKRQEEMINHWMEENTQKQREIERLRDVIHERDSILRERREGRFWMGQSKGDI